VAARDLRRFFTPEALQQIAAYLYTHDLTNFDPPVIPARAELVEKKLCSLQPGSVDELMLWLISNNNYVLSHPARRVNSTRHKLIKAEQTVVDDVYR